MDNKIFLIFRNCVPDSQIYISNSSGKTVSFHRVDDSGIETVEVSKLNCKYKISIQHFKCHSLEIDWNPFLDGVDIHASQELFDVSDENSRTFGVDVSEYLDVDLCEWLQTDGEI